MKFAGLVGGIILFCATSGYWVIEGGLVAICLAFAGLAVIAGEAFRIALEKELEADREDAELDKMKKEADGTSS